MAGSHCYRGYYIGGIRSHRAIHRFIAALKMKLFQIVMMCEAHGCLRVSVREILQQCTRRSGFAFFYCFIDSRLLVNRRRQFDKLKRY